MAIDQPQDLLYAVIREQDKRFTDVFTKAHPAMDKILSNMERKSLGGSNKFAFNVNIGDPATATKISSGTELIPAPRRQISRQGELEPARAILSYAIPNRELARSGGKNDLMDIYAKYPLAAVAGGRERFIRQFVRGASSAGTEPSSGAEGFNGFTTLNRDQNFTPGTSALSGVLGYTATVADDSTSAGQTATVFNIPQENATTDPCTGWYHQYINVDSMANDGEMKINQGIMRVSMADMLKESGLDILMSDEGSYLKAGRLVTMNGTVAINKPSLPSAALSKGRQGFMWGEVPWYWEPEIKLSDTTAYTTAAALTGLTIGLTTSTWITLVADGHKAQASGGYFDTLPPQRPTNQDVWVYQTILDLAIACRDLRRQLVITGTNQE